MIMWAGSVAGPIALPGTYSVRLNVAGQRITQPFTVVKDPRSSASDADLKEQFDFLMRIRDKTSEANDAVKTIRNVKAQLADRSKRITGAKTASFAQLAANLTARLDSVESEIYQVKNRSGQDPLNYPIRLNNKIAALAGVVGGTDAKPTSQSYTVFNDLSAQLDRQLQAMRGPLLVTLPLLNATLKQAGLPPIVPSATESTAAGPSEAATTEEDTDDR
jgi:hypothetical protein